MNKGGKGAQKLFTTSNGQTGLIYPDFISKDSENRIVADTKYKPIENIGNRDYLQVLAYMFRFDAAKGYYLYPNNSDEADLQMNLNQGSSYEKNIAAREDISVTKCGLTIPRDAESFEDFVFRLVQNESEFLEKFIGKRKE
ncbi:McrC family protein [Fructobacillus sp. W13]|uniref:McrC family protein n=1 Tax=Fructobacillus apis TaxID=2935017 RepID=A0ABT0ZNA0_9LACO|nr:McrC family protein [Fructobacillus apis]MCO0831477.1 McrC family protein [Fructobacillus apis]